jgi:hypothetical protein
MATTDTFTDAQGRHFVAGVEVSEEAWENHAGVTLPDLVLWEHRCANGVGGCTAISATYLAAVLELLERVGQTKYWREDATLLLEAAREDGYRAP